jgi:uncharacterized protein with HEPN domain
MPPTAREYLQHILDETSYLGANLPGLDREEFLRNPTLQRAFVRSIEVIGEAALRADALTRPTVCLLGGR